VRDVSIVVSNYRSVMTLDEYCKKHNVMGLSNLDTRALTKVLRETGCLNGVICTGAARWCGVAAVVAAVVPVLDAAMSHY
jgi:carbamoyl-phosphate synthase small subunit